MADTLDLSNETSADIRAAIGEMQNIQRRYRSSSLPWRLASEQLRALFAEMASRPSLDTLNGEYQKWARAQPGDVLGRGDAGEALDHPDTTDAQKAYLRNFIARHNRSSDPA